ncbi:AEC family transporter [Brevibacterium daeguense]|uniref:AEC family transporter n=1 Tax=Brevibacterium daeguense TaxID=909936 RepID=A0ABP8EM56_9MICO
MIGVLEGFGVISVVILTGFILGRTGVLGPTGQQVIAKLVFYAATPALLYITLAETEIGMIFSSALVATGGSALLVGIAAFVLTKAVRRRSLGESTISAMSVSYVNIGNLGIPIATYVLGDLSYVAPVLLFQLIVLAPVSMALLDSTRPGAGGEWWKAVVVVLRNPIVIGAAIGVASSLTGIRLPGVVHEPVSMLAAIAVPGALLAFGISLKDGWQLPVPGARSQLTMITTLKLIAQPLIAWVVGGPLLGYSGLDLMGIVVTSALPTAQNVYIYSLEYNQSERLARDAVFITTVLSVPTILVVAVLFG